MNNLKFSNFYNKSSLKHTINLKCIIRRQGYIAETHTVLTDDGYFLGLHRIPFRRNEKPKKKSKKPIVLLQHGLISSSADWLITGPKNSLPFLLADLGYDVWLGNFRGNTYSMEHINLTTDTYAFWDFSYDEHALLDLPAEVNHILARTGQQSLTLISHSMGGAASIAMAASFPEFNKKLNLFIIMAPAVYLTHMTSPLRLSFSQPEHLKAFSNFIVNHNPARINEDMVDIDRNICSFNKKSEESCENAIFLLGGYDKTNLNLSLVPAIFAHFPSATGARVALQLSQEQNSGRFCKFDFGEEKNQEVYHSPLPPSYPIETVKIPTAIFYAENDWLINYLDAQETIKKLPNVIKSYNVPDKNFTHFDYYYANDAPKVVYSDIFRFLEDNLDSAPGWNFQKKIRKVKKNIRRFTKLNRTPNT